MTNAIYHSTEPHFADEIKLLYAKESLNSVQKKVSKDHKSLSTRLRPNKISLTVTKTE